MSDSCAYCYPDECTCRDCAHLDSAMVDLGVERERVAGLRAERDRLRAEVDSLKRILASSVLPLVTTDGTSMVVDSVGGVATDSEGMPEYVVIRRTDADGRTVVRKYVSAAERDRLKAENARLREAADVGFDLASALRTDVSDPKVRVAIALLVAQDETKGSDK